MGIEHFQLTGIYSEVRVLVTLVCPLYLGIESLPTERMLRHWNDDRRRAKNDNDLRRWGSTRAGAEDQIK